jgi:sporulation integral membrane protein YtvI
VNQHQLKRLIFVLAIGGFLFFTGKYIFPLIFPFLLGFLLAYMAEPAVKYMEKRLPRSPSSALGVSFLLVGIFFFFAIAGGLLVRSIGDLSGKLPDLEAAVQESSRTLEGFLLGIADNAPAGLRSILKRGVLGLFDSGTLLELGFDKVPRVLSGVVSHLPGGALAVCTAVVSAFLISARMPRLTALVPKSWSAWASPAFKHIRTAVGGWLIAQGKLAGLTFLVCCAGLWLLGIGYAPIWAGAVALVDAVPLLGSGLVLVPWSLVAFLQGDSGKGLGLLITFGAAFLLRTVLEPRLLGKQMGLDPLVTLVALYLGFRLGGFWGLVLSPILAITTIELTRTIT